MIWRQLEHPNILPCFGISDDVFYPQLAMISPWMPNGHLISYLSKNPSVKRIDLVSSPKSPHHSCCLRGSRYAGLQRDFPTFMAKVRRLYMGTFA